MVRQLPGVRPARAGVSRWWQRRAAIGASSLRTRGGVPAIGDALVNIVAFAVTCAAGAAYPFVRRELYRESAAARREILGVPVITLAGVVFFLFTVWIVLRYAVDPGLSLGLGIAVPQLTTLVLYAISFGLYFISGLYRRARVVGTELEVWFTEATSADH
jgi:hypothetical protein